MSTKCHYTRWDSQFHADKELRSRFTNLMKAHYAPDWNPDSPRWETVEARLLGRLQWTESQVESATLENAYQSLHYAVYGDAATTKITTDTFRPAWRPSETLRPESVAPNGYVTNPADPTAYAESGTLEWRDIPYDKRLKWLEKYDLNKVKWTRPLNKDGEPIKNRQLVHVADFNQRWRDIEYAEGDNPADIEIRKAEAKAKKTAFPPGK